MKRSTFLAIVPLMLLQLCTSAWAETYPAKPVKLVVPYAPGGTGDIIGRLIARELTARLGQQFVIDNRPGAGGNIGAEFVAKASQADGYTLLLASTSLASSPALQSKLAFAPERDLAPVGLVASIPNIVVVNPSLPVKNIRELVALAKAKPGTINFGSSGNGTSNHLATELFKAQAGVDIVHVPYKSAGQVFPDLMAGHVNMIIDLMPSAISHVRSGKLRALAVTSPQRSKVAPDLPTVAEAGVPGYEFVGWFGILAPAKTPPEVVKKLNTALNEVLRDETLRQKLLEQGAEPNAGTPEQFRSHLRKETERWARLVKDAKLPPLD